MTKLTQSILSINLINIDPYFIYLIFGMQRTHGKIINPSLCFHSSNKARILKPLKSQSNYISYLKGYNVTIFVFF